MITCKECGFTANRLQWTHFRYNCTGRFKNGKEYIKEYPNELLVSPELAKKTAVTVENLILKYGELEGIARWNKYIEKQSISNSYLYKKDKYGWTEEQFDNFNKSRAVKLENMIVKHGEEIGLKKWHEYCDKQKYTKSKEYLIEKYGEEIGYAKYLEILNKKRSPLDPTILSKKLNISVDDAVTIICNRGSYRYTSLLEKQFVLAIEESIGPLEHTSFRKPYGKWCVDLNRYVVYDIKHKDCIIEFNGDYWHANPSYYNQYDFIRGTPVHEIWNRDAAKMREATTSGFRTLVVWESEYTKNKIETIQGVIKWILKEQQ